LETHPHAPLLFFLSSPSFLLVFPLLLLKHIETERVRLEMRERDLLRERCRREGETEGESGFERGRSGERERDAEERSGGRETERPTRDQMERES
jgi:hypothetical protein